MLVVGKARVGRELRLELDVEFAATLKLWLEVEFNALLVLEDEDTGSPGQV